MRLGKGQRQRTTEESKSHETVNLDGVELSWL